MKKMAFVLVLALMVACATVFSQVNLPEHQFVAGNWTVTGDRLYQNDEKSGLAKVNIRAPQEGEMLYEFAARYEGGAEDGHGGFGLHIFVDSVYSEKSWGSGQSFMLWLNYDEKPLNRNIPAGLSAQIYRSVSHSQMDLVESFDLNEYADLLTDENLAEPVPFKIIVDGNTGRVDIYDPTVDDDSFYRLNLNINNRPLKANWVVLRTNGMKLSFTN
jgi:hypothetical protein